MRVIKLETMIPFGKHKGEQVEDLVEDSPEYVRWLCENTDIEFDDMVLEALERREARP